MRLSKNKILTIDRYGRVWIPKAIRSQFDTNMFRISVEDGRIVLTPVRRMRVILDDGTILEIRSKRKSAQQTE